MLRLKTFCLDWTICLDRKDQFIELFEHYKEGRCLHMEDNDGSDVELDWGYQPEQIDES